MFKRQTRFKFNTAAAAACLALLLVPGCKKEEEGGGESKAEAKGKPTNTADKPDVAKPDDKKPDSAKPDQKNEKPDSDSATVHAEEVSYEAGGTTMKGYLVYDKSKKGPRPGVLVVHEWWGHNDYARKRARMLAELGYTALAVDMYGDGKQAAHPKDAMKFMNETLSNIENAEARFMAARKLLEEHESSDPKKTAAIGYCFGGGVVLHAARRGMDLAGVVSFHGSLEGKAAAKKGEIKAPMLVLHGAADPFVPEKQVAAFKKEMAEAEAKMELVAYEGAKHAFTNPGASELGKKFKLPLEYNQEADEKSWAAMQDFLKKVFEG